MMNLLKERMFDGTLTSETQKLNQNLKPQISLAQMLLQWWGLAIVSYTGRSGWWQEEIIQHNPDFTTVFTPHCILLCHHWVCMQDLDLLDYGEIWDQCSVQLGRHLYSTSWFSGDNFKWLMMGLSPGIMPCFILSRVKAPWVGQIPWVGHYWLWIT